MKFCKDCETYDNGYCPIKGYNVSINAEFCGDFKKPTVFLFDVDREDLYHSSKPEIKERTKERLIKIAECGMEEISTAVFGFKGIIGDLLIEKVWYYTNDDFIDYMNWAMGLIIKHLLTELKERK